MTSLAKRSFLKSLAAIAAAAPVLLSGKALAFAPSSEVPAAMPVSSPLWSTLGHATDGTDPGTALTALPRFTPDIRALAGREVELEGYLQFLGSGFGRREYLLSSAPFHCPFCYAGGRGSLVKIFGRDHLPDTDGTMTLRGTLSLQETDPEEFYYTLEGARRV